MYFVAYNISITTKRKMIAKALILLLVVSVHSALLLVNADGEATYGKAVLTMELIDNAPPLEVTFEAADAWTFHSKVVDMDGDGMKDYIAIYKKLDGNGETVSGIHVYVTSFKSTLPDKSTIVRIPTIEMEFPDTFSVQCLHFSKEQSDMILVSDGKEYVLDADDWMGLLRMVETGKMLQVKLGLPLSRTRKETSPEATCPEDETTGDCDPCCGPAPCCITGPLPDCEIDIDEDGWMTAVCPGDDF